MTVMGILFVVFIFGFGYSNYLQSQVYMLEREKEYEAASMIMRSAITEAMYLLHFDNQVFINKIKSVTAEDFKQPYVIYTAKADASKKMLDEVFKKSSNNELEVAFELREVAPFRDFKKTGEKTLRLGVTGKIRAGSLNLKYECETLLRFAAVIYDRLEGEAKTIEMSPERVSAVISDVKSIGNGKYYGICVYNGYDVKAAKELAQKSPKFRAMLVNPAGLVLLNKAFVTEGYTLTFSPPVPLPPR